MSDDRKDQRVKVPTLKAKYKSATVDEFIDQYAGDISRGGIFIKTPKPSSIGQLLKIEIQLKDGAPVISAVGRVVWRREQPEGGQAAGMGIKFIKLEPESVPIIERIVERKAPGEGPHFDDPSETASAGASETNSEFFGQTNPQAEMPAEQDRTMMRQMSAFLGEALRGAKEEPKPEAPKKPVPKSTMIGMPAVSPAAFKQAEDAIKKADEAKKEEPKPAEPAKAEEPKPAEPAKAEEPKKPEPAKAEEPKPAEPPKKPMPKGTLVGMSAVLPQVEPAKAEPAKPAIAVPDAPGFSDEPLEAATAVTSKDALEKALADASKPEEFEGDPTHVADKGELDKLLEKSNEDAPAKAEEPVVEAKKSEPAEEPKKLDAAPKEEPKKAEPAEEPKKAEAAAPPTTSSALDAAAAAAAAAPKDEPKKAEPKKAEPKKAEEPAKPAAVAPKAEEPAKKSPVGMIVGVLVAAGLAVGGYLYVNQNNGAANTGNTPAVVDSGVAPAEPADTGVAPAVEPTPAVEDSAAPASEDASAAEPAAEDSGAAAQAQAPEPTPTPARAATPDAAAPRPAPRPATSGDAGAARPRPRPATPPATGGGGGEAAGSGGAAGSGSAGGTVPENPI